MGKLSPPRASACDDSRPAIRQSLNLWCREQESNLHGVATGGF
jgi:hypothetical protein